MLTKTKKDIIFDMRCLQDEAYRTRGVGKVASAIVTHARNYLAPAQGWQIVGLLDRELPDLAPQHLELMDELRYAASSRGVSRSTVFVSLSPMTHDPLFVARLLNDPSVFPATIFFDFIPLAEPERYLPGPAERIAYNLRLYWLSRYRLFGAISTASAGELRERLSIATSDIAAIGAPIDPSFIGNQPYLGKRRCILVIGGGDPRKNVECALRAHGRSELLQREKVEIIVTGNYPKNWRQELEDLHKSSGGRSTLLKFTGRPIEAVDHAECASRPISRKGSFGVMVSCANGTSVPPPVL